MISDMPFFIIVAMAEIDPRYEPFYGRIVKRLHKYIKEAHVPFESPI